MALQLRIFKWNFVKNSSIYAFNSDINKNAIFRIYSFRLPLFHRFVFCILFAGKHNQAIVHDNPKHRFICGEGKVFCQIIIQL